VSEKEERYDAIVAAAMHLSPSAIYDLRRLAWEKTKAPSKWWQQYPEGQIAAFVERVLRVISEDTGGWHGIPWQEPGKELEDAD
jgi:hypothetical protein